MPIYTVTRWWAIAEGFESEDFDVEADNPEAALTSPDLPERFCNDHEDRSVVYVRPSLN